jgi:hypothetical protein
MNPNEVQREVAKRRMLAEAGYEFHVVHDVWVNALLDRQLDGTIAQSLTVEQLVRWIKVGLAGEVAERARSRSLRDDRPPRSPAPA